MLRRFVHIRHSPSKLLAFCHHPDSAPEPPVIMDTALLPASAQTRELHVVNCEDLPRRSTSSGLSPTLPRPSTETVAPADEPNDSELPPSYAESETIFEPVTFIFSQASHNAMLLSPLSDTPGNLPLFLISVDLNCFNPSANITKIRRGGSEDAPVISTFEMGASSGFSFVTIRGQRRAFHQVLSKAMDYNSKHGWHFDPSNPLVFIWRGEELTCSTTNGVKAKYAPLKTLAIFRSQSLYRATGRTTATIEIWPEAYNNRALLTQAITGALILERRRQMPISK